MALECARRDGHTECVKLLEQAEYTIPYDKVEFSLHCGGVVSRDSTDMTPLAEFCTDERYSHMMESTMGMVLKPLTKKLPNSYGIAMDGTVTMAVL